ncbi:MAG: 50S ribosomal protein L1 [Patescibacteria group bacterium]|nr:50S ribosomal protein L1 [Patescibacteria group bacterium]
MAHSKRYKELLASYDARKSYSPAEAVELVKKLSTTKFDSSVEVHIRLGIDPKKSDQMVRSTVALPHGTGKTKKVAAFVSGDKEKEAKEAGADLIGGEELIAKIASTGKIEFDIAVATPDMMPKLAKVAKILGPRGLMPSPKNDTVTPNIKKAIEEMKKGKVAFKSDDTGNIHQAIGKASFTAEQLADNFTAFMEAVRKAKPSSSKGVYLVSVTVAPTMGPGVKVSV